MTALDLRRRQIEAETRAYKAVAAALDAIGDRIRLAEGDYADLRSAIATEACAMEAALDDLTMRKIAGGFEPIERGES